MTDDEKHNLAVLLAERDRYRLCLERIAARCENYSAADIRAVIADALLCTVEELENQQ